MAKTIRLFCCAGMSTSMLVQKMQTEAKKQGKDYDIAAYSLTEVDKEAPAADVILIGPQVRYALKDVKSKFPEIPIEVIDMRMYGMMDAKGTLSLAEKYL